jgi:hypothetical protein
MVDKIFKEINSRIRNREKHVEDKSKWDFSFFLKIFTDILDHNF